jgi:hypothetical protein
MTQPFLSNLSEKQYFIHACFVHDLQQFYKQWIEQKKGRIQYFTTTPNGLLQHKYWQPSSTCCQSGQLLSPNNIDVKIGYWTPFTWKPILPQLKQQAMKDEAYQCQLIVVVAMIVSI